MKAIRYSQKIEVIPTEPDNDLEASQEDLLSSMYERTKRYLPGGQGQPSFKFRADREFQLYLEDNEKKSLFANSNKGKSFFSSKTKKSQYSGRE